MKKIIILSILVLTGCAASQTQPNFTPYISDYQCGSVDGIDYRCLTAKQAKEIAELEEQTQKDAWKMLVERDQKLKGLFHEW